MSDGGSLKYFSAKQNMPSHPFTPTDCFRSRKAQNRRQNIKYSAHHVTAHPGGTCSPKTVVLAEGHDPSAPSATGLLFSPACQNGHLLTVRDITHALSSCAWSKARSAMGSRILLKASLKIGHICSTTFTYRTAALTAQNYSFNN